MKFKMFLVCLFCANLLLGQTVDFSVVNDTLVFQVPKNLLEKVKGLAVEVVEYDTVSLDQIPNLTNIDSLHDGSVADSITVTIFYSDLQVQTYVCGNLIQAQPKLQQFKIRNCYYFNCERLVGTDAAPYTQMEFQILDKTKNLTQKVFLKPNNHKADLVILPTQGYLNVIVTKRQP